MTLRYFRLKASIDEYQFNIIDFRTRGVFFLHIEGDKEMFLLSDYLFYNPLIINRKSNDRYTIKPCNKCQSLSDAYSPDVLAWAFTPDEVEHSNALCCKDIVDDYIDSETLHKLLTSPNIKINSLLNSSITKSISRGYYKAEILNDTRYDDGESNTLILYSQPANMDAIVCMINYAIPMYNSYCFFDYYGIAHNSRALRDSQDVL